MPGKSLSQTAWLWLPQESQCFRNFEQRLAPSQCVCISLSDFVYFQQVACAVGFVPGFSSLEPVSFKLRDAALNLQQLSFNMEF